MSTATSFDPGSFKDPEGRVLHHGEQVLRVMSPSAQERVKRYWSSGLVPELIEDGLMVQSTLVDAQSAGLPAHLATGAVIEHVRIPTVSYPYEWSFDMLREAALVTLSLMERCLERDAILKDATAYNVMFHNGRMRFIDTLSIDDYQAGSPWDGYAQFCREFLFPLMLTAYKGIEFQSGFRAHLNGFAASNLARMLRPRDKFRPGVLKHVVLQSRLEKSFAQQDVGTRSSFKDIEFSKELIFANVRGLRKLIDGMIYEPVGSEWVDYGNEHSYSASDEEKKRAFVKSAVNRLSPKQVVDLGTNTGSYAFLAASLSDRVIAIDIDPACINALLHKCRENNITNMTPMVGDLLNPSPALGWALCERQPLLNRLKSDAFLALALVHHICISGNVPVDQFVDLLAETAPGGVVEWVGKEDSMVQRMLRNRSDVFDNYTWAEFRSSISERFDLVDTLETHDGHRKLCLLAPKGIGA